MDTRLFYVAFFGDLPLFNQGYVIKGLPRNGYKAYIETIFDIHIVDSHFHTFSTKILHFYNPKLKRRICFFLILADPRSSFSAEIWKIFFYSSTLLADRIKHSKMLS